MSKKIVMSDYRVVAKSFDKRMASQDGLPLWLRIVHAAGAEMNRSGHAYFGGWANLADYVKVDGKPMPLRTKVYEGVKKAIELGYLSPDSDVDCLVFYAADTQKAARSGYGCKNPKHADKCRTAVEIAEAVAEAYEAEELPAFDPKTGEVLEEAVEASESVSEETEASEDQEVMVEAENATQSLVGASEADVEVDASDLADWEEDIKEEADMTDEEFRAWFEGASQVEQDVAFYGLNYKKFDALAKVVLVAQEAAKDEYDEWGTNSAFRYTYAEQAVSYNGPARQQKELVKAGSSDLMDQEW